MFLTLLKIWVHSWLQFPSNRYPFTLLPEPILTSCQWDSWECFSISEILIKIQKHSFHENVFENVVYKMVVISFSHQCIKDVITFNFVGYSVYFSLSKLKWSWHSESKTCIQNQYPVDILIPFSALAICYFCHSSRRGALRIHNES